MEKILSLRDFLTIVFKHKWGILLLFTLIVLTVTVLTSVWPLKYEASAKILLKFDREGVSLSRSSPSAKTTLTMKGTEEEIRSEIEILNTRFIIEKVVKNLWNDLTRTPDEKPTSFGQKIKALFKRTFHRVVGLLNRIGYSLGLVQELGPFETQVSNLQRNLRIEAIKDSNIIRVKYSSSDPTLSAKVVNTLTALYLEYHIKVHKAPQAHEFFLKQKELLRKKLKGQEEKLKDFMQEWNVSSIEIQKKLTLENLSLLTLENKNLQSKIEETQKSTDSLKYAFSQRTNYLQKDDRRRAVMGGDSVSKELEKNILVNEANLEGLKAKSEMLEGQLEYYQSRIHALDEKGIELRRLERDLVILEESYKTYLSRLEDVRISEALDLAHISNVSIIEPATVPFSPVRKISFMPRRIFHITVGIFVGLIVGLTYAFLAEYFDHTFNSREQIEQLLNIPCLASLPKE